MLYEVITNGSRSGGNAALLDTAFLYGGSAQWIEQMQAAYAKNPASVPESWRARNNFV